MIGYLKGTVLDLSNRICLMLVGGVGYEVFVPDRVTALPSEEKELFVYTHVREDIFQLYGFLSMDEKRFFELLLSVNGIGPKSALEIMSHDPRVILHAILHEDLGTLTKIPGIGKKTAERMLIDLRGKAEKYMGLMGDDAYMRVHTHKGGIGQLEVQCADVISALEALGYDRRTIIPVLQSMRGGMGPSADDSEEVIIKYCLQHV